jgi:hypothetical protein
MTKCQCGKEYRKGTLAVVVGGPSKKLAGKRVCPECAAGGILLVASKRPVVHSDDGSIAREERTILRSALKPIIKNLDAQVKALTMTERPAGSLSPEQVEAVQFVKGKIEGMENMLAVLKNAAKEAS